MSRAKKQSFVLYYDIREPLELLNDDERGKLFTAVLDYAENGIIPEFSGMLAMAFAFIKKSIDRDTEKWDSTRESRIDAGRKGGLAKQANATFAKQNNQSVANLANVAVPVPVPAPVPAPVPDNVPVPVPAPVCINVGNPQRAKRFIPPSVDDVEAYCIERGNGVNAQRFVDFYEAKGWKIGKEKMKDWKAAVRTWEQRADSKAASNIPAAADYY